MGTLETILVVLAVYVLGFIALRASREIERTEPDEG